MKDITMNITRFKVMKRRDFAQAIEFQTIYKITVNHQQILKFIPICKGAEIYLLIVLAVK
jgi:hypothetical protein